jgi:two-component system phosphate regulon response regulator PhoB
MASILLADDDELVGDVVQAALAEIGHFVTVVGNGAEAVRVTALKSPDLVILDCSMPEMNGVEALMRIRSSASGYNIPVLMLTARRNPMDVEIAMRAGASRYLKKPFHPDQLMCVVEDMLETLAAAKGSFAS